MKQRSMMLRKQLPLVLAPIDPIPTLPSSAERPLVVALGELLLAAAAQEARSRGDGNER